MSKINNHDYINTENSEGNIDDNKDNLNKNSNGKMSAYEKKMSIVFLLLYFIQGIPLGFISGCQVLLAASDVKFTDLAIFSICIYPFSFKILTAPIVDTYYFSSIGRRRSYILPIQYALTFIYLMMWFKNITFWIEQKEIYLISGMSFFMILLVAHQDIAVDGWVLNSYSFQNVHYGSVVQSIGQTLGVVVGSNIMVNFTSKSFTKYLFGLDESLITIEQFSLFIALLILSVTLYVHFFTSESEDKNAEDESLQQTISNIKTILQNKNVQILILHLITFQIGFKTVISSTPWKLIQAGVPKELITTVSTFFTVIGMGISILVSKNLQVGEEMRLVLSLIKFRYLDCFIQFLIVMSFQELNQFNGLLIVLSQLCTLGLSQAIFVSQSGFFNRVADPLIGASYLTLLNSAYNLGGAISETIALSSIGIFGYEMTVMMGGVFGLIHYIFFKDKLIKMVSDNNDQWRLNKPQQKKL